MKKIVILFLHIIYWMGVTFALFLLYNLLKLNANAATPNMWYFVKIVMGGVYIPSIIGFYGAYFKLFKELKQKKHKVYVVGSLIVYSLGAILCMIFLQLLIGKDTLFEAFFEKFIFFFAIGLFNGVIAKILRASINWYNERMVKDTLLMKNQEMELALVKAQIDPHFLFNTINNIDILIQKDADMASAYLNKLSEIMRFMLYETKVEKIPLTKEVEYIKRYIDLQKIRSSNPNYVEFEIPDNLPYIEIAPMVLIPFIENAFKHSAKKKEDKVVHIAISFKEGKLLFDCQNIFQPMKIIVDEHNGLGSQLIEKRLQLLYPNNHQLKVEKLEEVYKVSLEINFEIV